MSLRVDLPGADAPERSVESLTGDFAGDASTGEDRPRLGFWWEKRRLEESSAWFERSWWTAAGVMLLLWSFRLLNSVTAFPWVTVVVVTAGAGGLLTVVASWRPAASSRAHGSAQPWWTWACLAAALAALVVWCLLQVYKAPGYGTDEMAFDQYAAGLLVHGIDPYTRSMAPAFSRFHVQPDGYTFRLDGTPVTTLSYPALSFLIYVPLLLAGLHTQAAVVANVAAWALAVVLCFCTLPRPMRPMAIVIGSLSVYIGYAVGGVTTALFVPLLVVAAWRWDSFSTTRGWRSWTGPACLGLAMCINQAPWFVLPFVLVGIAGRARALASTNCSGPSAGGRAMGRPEGWAGALGEAGRYLSVAAVAFAIPNIAFVVWSPGAWIHGILLPLTAHTVPAGQGLVALSLYLHMGGGSLVAYTALSVLVMAGLLAIYAATYPRLRPVTFLLPALVLFFATRSYGSYLVGLIPAALVAAATTGTSEPVSQAQTSPRARRGAWRRSTLRRWPVVAGATGAIGVAALVALLSGSPLSVSISGVKTTGQLATVDQVNVRVHNRSSSPQRPHFTVNSGDAVTAFWLANGGPAVLKPGQSADYTLLSPNFYAQPPLTGGFQVVAFTTSPAAISHSGSYLPTTDHIALVPDAIGHLITIGHAVTVKAEVLDRLNRPVRRAGIPVYLGQIVYGQRGLQYGEAVINGGPPGRTPVSALTNAQGVATFTVVGTQPTANPVYFEANLVNGSAYYPYGYSQILPIRFGTGR